MKQLYLANLYQSSTMKQLYLANLYQSSTIKQLYLANLCQSSTIKQLYLANLYQSSTLLSRFRPLSLFFHSHSNFQLVQLFASINERAITKSYNKDTIIIPQ